MRDFWLDFGGVMDYLSGDGALRLCFVDDGIGEVLGFEVLSLLAYLGYSLDGHDYDYECSEDGLGYTVGAVSYLNSYVEPSWQMGDRCEVFTAVPVVHVYGSLYVGRYRFVSYADVRWVLPLDLLLYWEYERNNLCVDGCDYGSGFDSYLDICAVDTVKEDFRELFDILFWRYDIFCYGARYTRWLLDEFVWYMLEVVEQKSAARVMFFKDSFALNWDFVMVVGSSSDMDMLRVEFPSLFV